MAEKKNIFVDELVSTFDQLSNLNHGSAVGQWAVRQAVESARRRLEEEADRAADYPFGAVLMMATKLPIPDYLKHENFISYHAHDVRDSRDERLLALMSEMDRRLQSQIFCAAFEITERHLRNVAALTYFQLRNEGAGKRVTLPFDKGDFHARQPKWRQEKFRRQIGTPSYFAAYVAFRYRNGMLDFLRGLLDGLTICHESGPFWRGLAIAFTNYRTIEFCRHRMVHVLGEYDADALRPFGVGTKSRVQQMTSVSVLTGKQTLLPTSKDVGWCLDRLAGVALHVHRGVSDAFGITPWK